MWKIKPAKTKNYYKSIAVYERKIRSRKLLYSFKRHKNIGNESTLMVDRSNGKFTRANVKSREKNRASGSRNTCTAIKRHGASRRCAGAKFLRSSPVLNADRGPRKALFASSTPVHPPCFLSERSPPTLAIVIRCFVALRAVFSRFSSYNESVSADEAAIKRNDVNSVSRHRPSFYVRYFEL